MWCVWLLQCYIVLDATECECAQPVLATALREEKLHKYYARVPSGEEVENE